MKPTLQPGAKTEFAFKVPANKTVPHLYPEAHEFQQMPTVFATGFMVGLMEWTCIKVLEPHLDEGEGSLGIHVDVSHTAATVPGQTVTVEAECTKIEGRKVSFHVKARDEIDTIGEGMHQRMVVNTDKFVSKVNEKAKKAHATEIARKAG